jgi:hypothetical protein
MSRFVIAAVALGSVIGAAQAQTAKSSGTDVKPILENERMRVLEMMFKPGAKTSSLSQSNRFVYALTDGSLVFSPPGKTPYELSFKAGEALWLPSEAMVTENDSGKEIRALVVEFKEGAPVRVAQRAKFRGKVKARGKGGGAKAATAKGKTNVKGKRVAGKRG